MKRRRCSDSTSSSTSVWRIKVNPPSSSDDSNTKALARKVADHYSARRNQSIEEREASPIIRLRKLHNWIKSVLINLCTRPGDAVLDLACGKGGDLIKWDKAGIGSYFGIDIAQGSVQDFYARYKASQFRFPARVICGDCFDVGALDRVLADKKRSEFDICSCQFALHYSWSSEARARTALANVSASLRPGGYFIGTMPDANVLVKKLRQAKGLFFGNSLYSVTFDDEYSEKKFQSSSPFGIKYMFHLEGVVDCPEWIVPFNAFKSLAEDYGLELVSVQNFNDFVDQYLRVPKYVDLMYKIGAIRDQRTLSQDEWEVAHLYSTFVFRKRVSAKRFL